MAISNIFDFAIEGVFNARGEMYSLTRNEALANAIKLWLATPKGDIVNYPYKGGLVYQFIHVLLTQENANALKDAITRGLKEDFDTPLEVRQIEVVPNKSARKWQIYAQVYAPQYGALATLDLSVTNNS